MGPDKAVGPGRPAAKKQVGAAKEVEAEVMEILPHATFELRLANEDRVIAHLAGATKTNFVRLRPGDRVLVAISPHDRTRGRITRLLAD